QFQLVAHGLEIVDGIASARAGHVDEVDEHFGAFEMSQELMAEPEAAVRAFDQSRHVGDHKAPVVAETYDAEVRRQRGERIIGDFRTRRGDARDERRLAGVRESDQPDVREQFQFEPQIFDLARFARLRLARCAIRGGREARVAHAAATALRDEHALALFREVRDQLQGFGLVTGLLVHERADRHRKFEVGASMAGAIRAHAVLAAFSGELGVEPEIDERVDVRAGDDVDRSAVTAVAAAGAAARDELFAAEREAAASAVPCFDVNVDFVYEQLFDGLDADDSPMRAVILEPHAPRYLREDRVVFADAGVQAGTEAASALAHDDGAAADDVAVMRFDAEPLRVGVAAVA